MPTDDQSGNRTVAVYQRLIMPYRVPFFKRVGSLLAEQNVKLLVFSADDQPLFGTDISESNTSHVALGSCFERNIQAREISEKLIIPKRLFRSLWRAKPDLIVTEDISALPSNLAVPLIALLRKTPFLIWTLGPSILGKQRSRWRFLLMPFISLLRNPASGFIVYSNWARNQMAMMFDKPVTAAPNSTVAREAIVADVAERVRRLDQSKELSLIFVGRMTAQKKLDVLLSALSIIKAQPTLVLVGDGEARERLEQQAAELGLSQRVSFYGDVRDQTFKNALIDAADIGIMPGLGGLFLQEAQSRGCPVIAGPADGTEQDLVLAATPELYLDDASAKNIAAKLDYLNSNRDLVKTYSKNVLRSVENVYNLDVMAENWVAAVMRQLTLRPEKRNAKSVAKGQIAGEEIA